MAPPLTNKEVSYLLWLGSLCGVAGLHRIYNKKYISGILWFTTGGLMGIGSVVDLFLIPGMVDDHNHRIRHKLGLTPEGIPRSTMGAVTDVVTSVKPASPPVAAYSQDQLMIRLAQAAQKHQGQLTVTRAVVETGANFELVERTLLQMLKKGYVTLDNHPETGVLIYNFQEL